MSAAGQPPLGLSSDALALLNAYGDAGWTWRRSTKNHIVVRAPDGVTTAAVSRNLYGKLARQKFRALEKWKEKNMTEAVQSLNGTDPPICAPTVDSVHPVRSADGRHRVSKQVLSNGEIRFVCAVCPWIGVSYRSVTQHYGSAHTTPMRKAMAKQSAEVATRAIRMALSPEETLVKIRSLVGTVDMAEVTQLRAENEALRSEVEAMRAEREALRDLLK